MNSAVKNPLVSIVVITYNSSQYVLETLESAKAQTYQNIELIVTDDSSTDNTVEICREWLNNNRSRFVRTELITSPVNTGTSANCNRGLRAAKGEWLKYIAGDDILTENCIEDLVGYTLEHPDCQIVVGKSIALYMHNNRKVYEQPLRHFFVSPQKQKELVLLQSPQSPNSLIRRQLIESLGGFDQTYIYIEDHPLFIKMAINGVYFHHLDKYVVVYRVRENSVTRSEPENVVNLKLFADYEKQVKNLTIPYFLKSGKLHYVLMLYLEIWLKKAIVKNGNKPTVLNKLLFRLMPLHIIAAMRYRCQQIKTWFL
jgi:glycosyltransferase involved in cell wall biosynthesis